MSFGERITRQISSFLNLRRALQLVWQSSPGWTIANAVLVSVQGFLPLVSLYLTKLIIDEITLVLAADEVRQEWSQLIGLIILAGATALLADWCASLANFVSEAQSKVVTDYVQNLLHAKSIAVDLEYYENPQYYDALHLAQQEAPYRPTYILNQLIQLAQSSISLVAIALLLISLHPIVALILLLAVLPVFWVRLKYANQLYRKWREWTPQEREADYLNWMMTHYSYAKEVRLFNLGSFLQQRFRQLRNLIRQDKLTLSRHRAQAEIFTQGTATLALFAILGFIVSQTAQGIISIGSLVMYYQAFQRGQALLRQTLSNVASLYENSLFIANLVDFLALKSTVVQPQNPLPLPQPWQWQIQFHQVQFNYPHSSRGILQDINLSIQAGETVALVGENGAGKTTLIKLLCRLYDPNQGQITINGIDIKQFSTTQLRQEISVVFQDFARYNLSVRDNIGFGNLDLRSQLEQIKSVAGAAGVDQAIQKLPYGYDTILGNQFAEGEELSIGEWQKIAIARAFLHPGSIIILDEPTSALDPEAEAEILAHFRQLTQNRTAILISHRLSTVKLADRIFVLEDGTISESGTHDQLMKFQGTYARLFETQAQYYR